MEEGNPDLIHVKPEDVGEPADIGLRDENDQPVLGALNTPEDIGRIADIGAANELAELEAKTLIPAQETVNTRELELARGRTNEQLNNLLAIERITEKYPAALVKIDDQVKHYDKLGRPFLITRTLENQPTLVVTQGVWLN